MTHEPAQPAESPEARALIDEFVDFARYLRNAPANPLDEKREVSVRMILTVADTFAASTARPTERGAVEGPSKEWCLNMARLEGNQEIGAGMPDHPLRAPEAATYQAAEVERLIGEAKEFADYAQTDGFDPSDALDLIREFAALDTQTATGRTMGGEVENQGCTLPPAGWWCSREPGHEGPCAARQKVAAQ